MSQTKAITEVNQTPIHALSELSQWEVEGRACRNLTNTAECFTSLWGNLMYTRGLDFTDDYREVTKFRLAAYERFMFGHRKPTQAVR